MRSGELLLWRREGHYPGEPIFLARPGASDEDDGVLLSVVLEGAAARCCPAAVVAKHMCMTPGGVEPLLRDMHCK